ncbi:RagB/SusD family nutrient uptake outer membrane protein [Draconibacterium sediminis]|uniref:RagB/SusD family nutrient uptake outer membrane protein n=1 Tax=Draconibacterium sediminis TaxID=1544798 RepID=UPI0026EBE6DA|nr:RagB/SusD family nutrient uptake outer membrane protein [Draconibacterium sediminis]
MKLKKYIYGLFLIGIFLLPGCEDFLDTTQMGVTSQNDFYNTDEEVTQALYAIYDKIQSDNVNTFQLKNMLSDDALAGGGGRGDNSWGEKLDEYAYGTNNSIITANFTKYYQIIYTANLLINNLENADTSVKQVAVAEAKTLRAYAYFELVTLWGPVPLVTTALNPDEYAQPNATIQELWAQIEADLSEAIPDLPLKSAQSEAQKANVSKGTAQAWLGKAYLYQEKYDQAAQQFEAVITSGEYELVDDFSTVTREASEFGPESVFEISYTKEVSSVTECTWIVAFCGPRSPWFSAGTSGISETAWGWVEPRQGLYDAFIEADDEVRRKATLMSEEELINDFGGSFRIDGNLPYGSYGLVRLKHGAWVAETPGEAFHTIGGVNYRVTRYSDVLLMAAEAYNRMSSPNDVKALEYVNMVRERVELPALTVTGNALFEAIKTERRLELAFEFVRYQDLIRWGDAADVLADQGKQIPRGDGTFFEFPDAGFKEKHWLLPFPESELLVNTNIVQNPGW